jgi:hypothetical protein
MKNKISTSKLINIVVATASLTALMFIGIIATTSFESTAQVRDSIPNPKPIVIKKKPPHK